MAEKALAKFVRQYLEHFERYDAHGDMAARNAIDALSVAERKELRSFCEEWLAIPVPPKHSGEIRMVGLGRFRMSRMQLGRLRDALAADDARTRQGPPEG